MKSRIDVDVMVRIDLSEASRRLSAHQIGALMAGIGYVTAAQSPELRRGDGGRKPSEAVPPSNPKSLDVAAAPQDGEPR